MYLASLSSCPSTPVLPTRSDPARSTRCSFERRTVSAPAARASTSTVKMQCEREDAMFIGVSLIARFVSPCAPADDDRSSYATCFTGQVFPLDPSCPAAAPSRVLGGRSAL